MEKYIFIDCVNLLKQLVDAGVLHTDPDNPNNLVLYRDAGEQEPEGWYSENLMSVAQEIREDPEAVEYLQEELRKAINPKTNVEDVEK